VGPGALAEPSTIAGNEWLVMGTNNGGSGGRLAAPD
jgi:hypothetical protein